jgi:membrane-associated phospholipid phosphatase
MTVDQHELYVTHGRSDAPALGALARFRRELAPQDYVVFFYLVFLNIAVLNSPSGPARDESLRNVVAFLIAQIATVIAVRTKWLTQRFAAPLLYRLIIYGCVQVTYFMFAQLLPLVNPRALDHQLYQLDLSLFGVEPAVYFDRFVTPTTTEWFAFFYFSYFFVLALHVLPILFVSRNARMISEFALGMILLFCMGHTLYILVPGYGPYKAMPELFNHQLSPGIWWNTTRTLVAQSGAQKDIFPSLHTAAPTFLLLFSFHRRAELPFRYTWPLVAFFAVNIVIATMFLRWHYVIDVVAGLILAVVAHTLAVRLSEREAQRRDAQGLGPMWPQWPAKAAR